MGGCGACGTTWTKATHYRGQGCPAKPHDMCSVCGKVFPKNTHKTKPICLGYSIYRHENWPRFDPDTWEKELEMAWDDPDRAVTVFETKIRAEGKAICSGLIVPAEEYKLIKKHRKELSN